MTPSSLNSFFSVSRLALKRAWYFRNEQFYFCLLSMRVPANYVPVLAVRARPIVHHSVEALHNKRKEVCSVRVLSETLSKTRTSSIAKLKIFVLVN